MTFPKQMDGRGISNYKVALLESWYILPKSQSKLYYDLILYVNIYIA